jgi:ATP-dependent Clp protease ATP-binding subunit ClpB
VTQIVRLQLNALSKMLKEKSIIFSATDEAINSLSAKGYNPQFGARPIKRVIQKEVLNNLSKELLSGKISAQSSILLDAFDDQFVFRNK